MIDYQILSPQEPLTASDHAESDWNEFVATHPNGHILQRAEWAALKAQFGWQQELVTQRNATGQIDSGAHILYRSMVDLPRFAPFLDFIPGRYIAYIPKGPVVDWQDRTQTEACLNLIEARAAQRGSALLKIEPELADTAANRSLLLSHGFRPSIHHVQPRSTIVLDISDGENEILARMKSKWRYNVRLAKRKGVSIREGTRDDLNTFDELMRVTGERDGFHGHDAAYYAEAFRLFVPENAVYLFAEYEGTPLAAIVVLIQGETAWYIWGASSNRERNRMPNHALQWAAIQWARERGAKRYDLWGIPDDVGKIAVGLEPEAEQGVPSEHLPIDTGRIDARDDLWGVYRLKQGFGGNVLRFVGAWDKPIDPFGYQIYTVGLQAREEFPRVKIAARAVWTPIQQQIAPQAAEAIQEIDADLQLQTISGARQWRATLDQFEHPHLLQTWEWGEIKGQTGWVAERYSIVRQKETISAFQFLWRQLAPGLRIAYLPRGPLVDWQNQAHVNIALDAVQLVARQKQCIFAKIDPDVREDSPQGQQLLTNLILRGWCYSNEQIQFKNTGWTELPQDHHGQADAQVVDHDKKKGEGDASVEAHLLAQMKSKWRYNIRLAQRRGIKIRFGGIDDLRSFYALYADTGVRDGFLIRPFSYYSETWTTFLNAQKEPQNPAGGALLLAEHEDEDVPVAGLILLRYGAATWYFYGASSERRRRDMPNYLLQWEALLWAQQQGCTLYDWWGAPTNLDDPDDQMQGVWRFKQGFGAAFQPHVGAWDYATWRPLYFIFTQLLPLLRQLLRRIQSTPK